MAGYDLSQMRPTEEPPEDLGADEERLKEATEQVAQDREADAQGGIKARCAFIVFINEDGKAFATNDVEQAYTVESIATPDDMLRAVSEVRDDLIITKTAQTTAMQMMALGQQAALAEREQQEIARAQALIAKGGHLGPKGQPRRR